MCIRDRKETGLSKSYNSLVGELSSAGISSGIDFSILDDFVRVLKKINIYIWCNRKQIIPYLDYFVKKQGCAYDILVWIKTNPIPGCGRNYLNDKEYCLYFRKKANLHTTYERVHTYWITPVSYTHLDVYKRQLRTRTDRKKACFIRSSLRIDIQTGSWWITKIKHR